MENLREEHCDDSNDERNRLLQVCPRKLSNEGNPREHWQTKLNCKSWLGTSTEGEGNPIESTTLALGVTADIVPRPAANTEAPTTNTHIMKRELSSSKEQSRTTISTTFIETISCSQTIINNMNVSMRLCKSFVVMPIVYSLNFLRKAISFARDSRHCKLTTSFVRRLYQGLFLMYFISGINGQSSTILTSVLPSSSINISSINSSINNQTMHINSSSFISDMTSSIYVTPSASTKTMNSVNISLVPSPTQRISTNITAIHGHGSQTSSINMTSSLTMMSSSINMTTSGSVLEPSPAQTLNVTSSMASLSSYKLNETSLIMISSASSSNASISSAVIQNSINSSSASLRPSPGVSSVVMTTHSITPHTNATVLPNASNSSSPILTSTMLVNGSNSTWTITPTSTSKSSVNSSFNSINVTTSSFLITASPTPSTVSMSTSYLNTSVMSPTSTSYMNASFMSISPSLTVLSTTSRNYSSTYLNSTSMMYNVSMTSSVNQAMMISHSSTVIAMNASSSVLPVGPTPKPDQGIRTLNVNVKIVNEPFVAALNNKSTDDYRNLSSRVINAFHDIFSPLPGFRQVTVERFRAGSVIVDMKTNFNASSNVTTTQVKDAIIAHNATNNTQNFIFSQGIAVTDQCTSGFCINGGPCMSNATLSAFCNCPSGFTGVRCDKVITNGGYSTWSSFNDCSKSCKGGKMHRTRTCTNPSPQNGGKDCSSLGASYEEKDCNSDVLCPEIWAIIGVCCFLFLLLLILLIVCCIKRRKKNKNDCSTAATTGSQMNIVPLEIMVYDDEDPKGRRSPDGISNPEFVNESETEEDDIYKKQLLLFLKQSHLIKPGMVLSYGDDISDTSDYSNTNSRKVSSVSVQSDEEENNMRKDKKPQTSEL